MAYLKALTILRHSIACLTALRLVVIEDINKKVEELKDNECHIILMVLTNNLKSDGTTMIMSKYKDLVNQLKAKRFKRTSIVEY